MPEIRMIINTGFSGAEHEKEIVIDDAEWEGWTPEAREQYMQEELDAYVADEIDTEWEITE